jgi:hypothetical protein
VDTYRWHWEHSISIAQGLSMGSTRTLKGTLDALQAHQWGNTAFTGRTTCVIRDVRSHPLAQSSSEYNKCPGSITTAPHKVGVPHERLHVCGREAGGPNDTLRCEHNVARAHCNTEIPSTLTYTLHCTTLQESVVERCTALMHYTPQRLQASEPADANVGYLEGCLCILCLAVLLVERSERQPRCRPTLALSTCRCACVWVHVGAHVNRVCT